MSLNYNIGQARSQRRGRTEGDTERKTSLPGWCFWRDSQGLGRHRESRLPGLPEAQRPGKSEGSPHSPLAAQTGMESKLATSSRRPGLSLSGGARLVPTIADILNAEPSRARRPKVWRLFTHRLPEFRGDRRSCRERLSAGPSGPEPGAVRSGSR